MRFTLSRNAVKIIVPVLGVVHPPVARFRGIPVFPAPGKKVRAMRVTATATPCTSLEPAQITSWLDLAPEPSDRYDPPALWWRHEVMRDPAATSLSFCPKRDAVQAR